MGYLYTQLARIFENVIIGVGAHLTISVGGIFFFGSTVAFSWGAYGVVIAAQAGLPFAVSVLIGICASSLVGGLFAYLYTRVSTDSFAVITLASVLANEALLRSWERLTGGVLGISGIHRPEFAHTLFQIIILQGMCAAIILCLEHMLLHSPFGHSLRGLKENESLLATSGVSPKWVGVFVVGLASILSGVAGILVAWRFQFLEPSFGGIPILVVFLTVAVLAMRPSIRWLVGATVFVTMLPELFRFFELPSSIVGHLRLLLYSIFLIVLLLKLNEITPKRRTI